MNIVITNVFGINNKGDHALFDSLLSIITKNYPTAVITAVATDPQRNEPYYKYVTFVGLPWRSKQRNVFIRKLQIILKAFVFVILGGIFGSNKYAIIRCIRNADIAIASPGGYLEDSSWSYISHIAQMMLCLRFQTPLILAPQSIGPISSKKGCLLLSYVLKRCHSIFVRDHFSYDFVKKNTPKLGNTLFETTDMVLLNNSLVNNQDYSNKTQLNAIGITTVWWDFYGDIQKKINYIKSLHDVVIYYENKGYKVFILPQTVNEILKSDMEISREVAQGTGAVILPQPDSLKEYLSYYDKIDFIIGTRLHSCLLGIICNVPAISISYLPKCSYIMTTLGLSNYIIEINEVSFDKLLNISNQLEAQEYRRKYIKISDSKITELRNIFKDSFNQSMKKASAKACVQ